jgi:hypothetical protein
MRTTVKLFVLTAVLALPQIAAACPLCIDPRKETRVAYIGTTAALSLLPLGFLSGGLLWIRAKLRAAAAELG